MIDPKNTPISFRERSTKIPRKTLERLTSSASFVQKKKIIKRTYFERRLRHVTAAYVTRQIFIFGHHTRIRDSITPFFVPHPLGPIRRRFRDFPPIFDYSGKCTATSDAAREHVRVGKRVLP